MQDNCNFYASLKLNTVYIYGHTCSDSLDASPWLFHSFSHSSWADISLAISSRIEGAVSLWFLVWFVINGRHSQ